MHVDGLRDFLKWLPAIRRAIKIGILGMFSPGCLQVNAWITPGQIIEGVKERRSEKCSPIRILARKQMSRAFFKYPPHYFFAK